jgi:hypothetical protein
MPVLFRRSGWPALPDAFVVVSDTTEVMGHRIGNQPHW